MKRARSEGTLYLRKDGRYEVALFMNTSDGIKRVRRYADARTEAEAILVELRKKNDNGIKINSKEQKLGDYLDYWLLIVKSSSTRHSTYVSYESTVRLYLKPGLGKKYLTKLCVPDVQSFLDNQSKSGKSNRNLQKMRIVLSAALERACYEERLIRNVARQAKTPMYKPKEVLPWNLVQLGKFLEFARASPHYAIFVLMSLYGLRTGEALGLSWSDIDYDNRVILVRKQIHFINNQYGIAELKTKASRRELPLLDIAKRVLQKCPQSYEGPVPQLLFKTSGGLPVDYNNLRRSFKSISRKAGLPVITLHTLRHTAATNLKNLGIPAKDAQSILGHAHITTTLQIYQHTNLEGKSKALEQYEEQIFDFRTRSRQSLPSNVKAIA